VTWHNLTRPLSNLTRLLSDLTGSFAVVAAV